MMDTAAERNLLIAVDESPVSIDLLKAFCVLLRCAGFVTRMWSLRHSLLQQIPACIPCSTPDVL